jgi:hypothetical protein
LYWEKEWEYHLVVMVVVEEEVMKLQRSRVVEGSVMVVEVGVAGKRVQQLLPQVRVSLR